MLPKLHCEECSAKSQQQAFLISGRPVLNRWSAHVHCSRIQATGAPATRLGLSDGIVKTGLIEYLIL